MIIRPDPDLDDIELEGNKESVRALRENPLADWPVARAAHTLVGFHKVCVRYNRVRSQGRISFGRDRQYTDGIVIYLSPAVATAENYQSRMGDNHQLDSERFWESADVRVDPGVTWGQIEWDEPAAVGETLAYLMWQMSLDDGDADANSLIDPAVALLCHAAADRDHQVQVRRGLMSAGRVSWEADEGESGLGLFVPDRILARPRQERAPSEAHIKSAYGFSPPPPRLARRHNVTTDPEKLDDPRWQR